MSAKIFIVFMVPVLLTGTAINSALPVDHPTRSLTQKIWEDSLSRRRDSVSWMMYVLNGEMTATYEKSELYPAQRVVECAILLNRIEKTATETHYYFGFNGAANNKVYLSGGQLYTGIGYNEVKHYYFPITNGATLPMVDKPAECKTFFSNAEQRFIYFIQTYSGTINPWIKDQAAKHGVIL